MTITVNKSMNSITERAIRITFASATLFLVLLGALLVLKPEIDPAWRFISEYAIGRHGWMMSLAFLSLAASGLATVIALWSQLGISGKIGSAFLLIGALGLSLAGIFTTDPITTSMNAQSTSGQIHGLGAILGDGVPVGATVISLSLFRNRSWGSARWWMIGILAIIWLVYAWFIMSMPADGNFGPEVLIGWPNRLLMVSYCLWFIVTAWQALKLRQQIS
jgi:hypothetical protein